MYKLLCNGIRGKMYFTIKNMCNDLRSSVRINNVMTESFPVESGVRQGNNLAPTLFTIYINDLIPVINELDVGVSIGDLIPVINELDVGVSIGDSKISILLYADDIVLLSESPYGIQQQLNILKDWLKTWHMKANVDKTKVVQFRPRTTKQSIAKFFIDDKNVIVTDSYTYLGVLLTQHMDYKLTACQLARSASRAASKLISIYFENKGLPWRVFTHVHNSVVSPVMDYASAIWGQKRYGVCDEIQRRLIRCFLGVGKKCPIPSMEGDIGWLPPYVRHKVETVRMWCHLCLLPPDRLTRRVFDWDYRQAQLGMNTWAKNAGAILQDCGLEALKNTRLLTSSKKWVVDTAITKLTDIFELQWKVEINNMPKLRTYRELKSTFTCENYVKMLQPSSRSCIARLRSGVFPLAIETGRWRGKPIEERLCPVCPQPVVETEEHFLLSCPLYKDIRAKHINQLITSYDWNNIFNKDKLIHLFSDNFVYATSKMVKDSFSRRIN